jgi:hypothetical protein
MLVTHAYNLLFAGERKGGANKIRKENKISSLTVKMMG